jgi:hypothetical protein
MTGINLSLGRLFKIWWAIQWRGTLVGLLCCAVCYFLWQAFPWQALLSSWAPDVSVYAIAVLAAALIGIPFGLITVRWFLYASFSELQILTERQEPGAPPQFRIEPRIGNIAPHSFRTKPLALGQAVGAAKQVKPPDYPALEKAHRPKVQSDRRPQYARPH